jgi:hypothetical protein
VGSACHGGRAALIAAVAMAAAATAPPPASAADDASVVLPGTTLVALTADVDGDGEREVVRLVQGLGGGGRLLEVWGHDGDRWSAIGSDTLPTAIGVGEPVRESAAEATSLLLTRIGNRDRVLVLSAGVMVDDPSGGNCCLTISEVRLLRGGSVDVGLLQRQGGGAQFIQAADVDGDGTDDLVLHEGTFGPPEDGQTATLTVLRGGEGRFEPIFERTNADWNYGFTVGETDGADGLDLLFGPAPDGTIQRLAWDGEGFRSEEAHLDIGGVGDGGWLMGVADRAIVISLNNEVRVVRWARDRAPSTVDRLPTAAFGVLAVVGSGPDALILVQDSFGIGPAAPPPVAVHDLALQPLGSVGVSPASAGFWRLQSGEIASMVGIERNLFPYNGPIPGGIDKGGAAFVSSGYLIRPGGADGYQAQPISEMIGMQPVGIAGPQDAWLALSGSFGPPPGTAYLYWDGGGVRPSLLALRPLDQVLRPDEPGDVASIQLLGAVEIARDDEAATLLARGEGFQAAIAAPAGSTVLVVNGGASRVHDVGAEPIEVDILPRGTPERDQDFDAFIAVVTPDGRGTTQRWTGTFVREMPELSVSASTDGGSLSAMLAGSASPGSLVTANGIGVETSDDGSFAASIEAPIWPSTVVVTARDPLGNETTELVEVVGVVDYRGLPWAAIMVAATLLGGGVLYVRTPKRRTPVLASAGDGRLEELELDPIDGVEPRAR